MLFSPSGGGGGGGGLAASGPTTEGYGGNTLLEIQAQSHRVHPLPPSLNPLHMKGPTPLGCEWTDYGKHPSVQ